MSQVNQYLELLQHLLNLPNFEHIEPIKGTRTMDAQQANQLAINAFGLPQEEENLAKIANQLKNNKQNIYLIFNLHSSKLRETLAFLAMPVTVNQFDEEQGFYSLKPNHHGAFLFNQAYLADPKKSQPDFVLGNQQAYIDFKQQASFPKTDSWAIWLSFAHQLLESVTGHDINGLLKDVEQKYAQSFQFYTELAVFKEADNKANINILSLYQALSSVSDEKLKETPVINAVRAHNKLQPLAFKPSHATEDDSLARDLTSNPSYLLGHMDEQLSDELNTCADREIFALDNSQRLVLERLSRCQQGDILAVNGPPGSGKTAMLKAVIANQWVRAAWQKEPCPITVAVGSTNQSVTNVIGAFPKVLYQEDTPPPQALLHYQRWLPNNYIRNYGTYFPSQTSKNNIQDTSGYVLAQPSAMDALNVFEWTNENQGVSEIKNFTNFAKFYQQSASIRFDRAFDSLDAAIEACHAALSRNCEQITKLLAELNSHICDLKWLNRVFKLEGLVADFNHPKPRVSTGQAHKLANDLLCLCGEDKNAKLMLLSTLLREKIADEKIILEDLDDASLQGLTGQAFVIAFHSLLDVTLRVDAFHFTARYWEGCYIKDSLENILIARTEQNVEAGLRRLTMLTPCLVSTIQSAPKLFSLDKPSSKSSQRYLFGKADLLIMDESGQAQQRLGIPLLALTQKALVVGDVDQLSPVVTDIQLADEAYAYRSFGYSDQDFIYAQQQKLTTAGGNMLSLMRLASNFSHQGHGLMLRGHYRCQTNIIQFCNELIYDNKLMFLGFNAAERGPLPSFSWVDSCFPNQKVGTSKTSQGEAEYIAEFIFKRWSGIYEFYAEKDKKKNKPERCLSDLIAIVTPYNQQAKVLRSALKKKLSESAPQHGLDAKEIDDIVIGTVDSLQGAEKPIVIFSGVFSKFESGEPHFAKTPFLLNVAISRAQDCFVAFVCEQTYGIGQTYQADELEALRENSVRYLGYYLGQACHGNGRRRCQRLFPKRLVVMEATGKKKVLQKYLGADYLIIDTQGSITEYTPESLDFDYLVKHHFKPKFQLTSHGKQAIEQIVSQGASVDEIILATDDDYVGEAIAWHIYMQFRHHPDYQQKMTRVRLGAMTQEAVDIAFETKRVNKHEEDLNRFKTEDEKQAAKRAFLASRGKIDKGRVKAELFRELIDALVSSQSKSLPITHNQSDLLDELITYQTSQGSNGQTIDTQALPQAMGRVRLGLLDILYTDLNLKYQYKKHSEPQVVLTQGEHRFIGHLDGKDKAAMITQFKKHWQQHDEIQSKDLSSWKYDGMSSQLSQSLPAPSASTMQIIQSMHTEHGMSPALTMKLLQALYLGDF